jgi:phosphate transport system substrate-binding protein
MINGQSDVCPSSRSIKSEEVAKFAEKHGEGKQPIELSVALDGIVIYVHRDNPIRELSMSQLARIFCENPNSDAKDSKGKELKKFGPKATQWGDLSKDLPDEWKKANIVLYSRNAASGTYAFLKEQAMGNRDYDKKAQEMPGTSAIVNAIAKDKFGIGYGGVGYTAEGVRLLAISPEDGKPAVAATAQTIADRQYPIARALYIYISKKPEGVLKEYLNFILSDAGQEIIGGERVGFVKLPPALLKRQVDKLN